MKGILCFNLGKILYITEMWRHWNKNQRC